MGNERKGIGDIGFIARFGLNAVITHVGARQRLKREKVAWYPIESIMVPLYAELAGRQIPSRYYHLVTFLAEHVRETDDFFDNREAFPSWNETMEGIRSSRNRLNEGISGSGLPIEAKADMLTSLDQLGITAYRALRIQSLWTGVVSFQDAYAYRMDTSGILSRTIAHLGNTLVAVPSSQGGAVEDAFQRVGMALQYVDDMMDVQDDSPLDGNLIRAVLDENPVESAEFFGALYKNSSQAVLILDLLSYYAPSSLVRIRRLIDDELDPLSAISERIGGLMRRSVGFVLPRIKLCSKNADFFERFVLFKR